MKIDQVATFEHDHKYVNEFYIEIFGIDGKVRHTETIRNAVTNEGMNGILNTYFGSTAKISNWYIGLINNTSFTTLAVADTLASHSGWLEATNYSEGSRQTWTPTISTAQSVTGSANASFTINADGTIKGLFLASVATGTSGLLFGEAAFSSPASVVNGETFSVTYTVRMSN